MIIAQLSFLYLTVKWNLSYLTVIDQLYMEKIKMTVAQRITEIRQARGWSMTEVANLTGVTTSAVSNWEAGNSIPRQESLEKIARIFGVTKAFLETGEGSGEAPQDVLGILSRAKSQLSLATGVAVDQIVLDLRISA
ncbi:helix-turn-helix domain-containing protein [Rhizobium laguerreae]|uniref:helix-turn-helix domain-containing protein n=1 Tax=Rhizobium laguerreae TaxID=1076926 RepID=UPI001C925802|nr:helix-turn-helix transcriptional regulator [Rhizobium laguerreae]MBY3222788.1 helix-turn-helix transcriptional regulator [Rhizobium laguerreae]